MRLQFTGDIQGLESGIGILSKDLGFQIADDGKPIKVIKSEGPIKVSAKANEGCIVYNQKIHFFRALGLLIEELQQKNDFEVTEQPQFETNGVMFDCSRNAVLKVESVKLFIRKMAIMGLNMIMLYTEDTYTVESAPYFGYMRGRYSFEELKECDEYADIFGIEIIPCIQTLAHLTQALKWDYAKNIKDTEDILLVGEDKTYEFIEEMIKSAIAPFRSKRIQIGMDEAHYLGRGKYFDKNGYRARFEIMNEHLRKTIDITKKYELKPMMFSDMYFSSGSGKWNYYNLDYEIPEEYFMDNPKDVQLVYWDYYHNSEEFYEKQIEKHRRFGKDPVLCTTIWTWTGFGTNYSKTFKTTNAALNACKNEGIKEVYTSIWLNNGAEDNMFSALLGLQLHAEHGYEKVIDMQKVEKRFKTCCNAEFSSFMDMKYLDEIPGTGEDNLLASNHDDMHPANPAKYILWQDILIGLFDWHIEGLDLASHYSKLEQNMRDSMKTNNEWSFVFDLLQKLCSVLSLKCDLGLRIKTSYDNDDTGNLKFILVKEIPELYARVEALRETHRDQWLFTYKAFGWEVLDVRYGGLLARINTTSKRISDYLNGKISKIEELEEVRLPFDGFHKEDDPRMCFCWQYHRIFTANSVDA